MKIARISAKVLLWLLSFVLVLHALLIIAVQVPYVQNRIATEATDWLSHKTNSTITLKYFSFDFPFAVSLKGLYAETPGGDTLIYAGSLKAGIEPFSLLRNRLYIYKVKLENAKAKVLRSSDSTFNFDYFINAFKNPDRPQDTTGSFDIDVDEIELRDVSFLFDDRISDFTQRVFVGTLSVDVDDLSITDQVVEVDELELSNSRAWTCIGLSETDTGTAVTKDIGWTFWPGNITLNEVYYELEIAGVLDLQAEVGSLYVNPDEFDLDRQKIHVDNIDMEQVHYRMSIEPDPNSTAITEVDSPAGDSMELVRPQTGWDFHTGRLQITSSTVVIHLGEVAGSEYFDPRHLDFKVNELSAKDLVFNDRLMAGDIDALEATSGETYHVVAELEMLWDDEEISLEDFQFTTPHSEGEVSIQVVGNNRLWNRHPEDLNLEAVIDITTLSVFDALYFVPGLDTVLWYKHLESKTFSLVMDASGNIDHFFLNTLEFRETSGLADVDLSGEFARLDSPDEMNGNLDIERVFVQYSLFDGFLQDSLKPAGIQMPESIELSGSVKGSLHNLVVGLRGAIDSASLALDGSLAWTDSINTTYDLVLHVEGLALGHYLKNDSVGAVSFEAETRGKGYATHSRSGTAVLRLTEATFMGYRYQGLYAAATLNNEQLDISSTYSDSNLIYDLEGSMSIGVDNPSYAIDLDLEGIDLQALNILDYDARYSGQVRGEFAFQEDKDLIGNLSITRLGVVRGEREAFIDSFLIVSARDTGYYSLQVKSDLLTLDYAGNVSVTELPAVVEAAIYQHYGLGDSAKTMVLDDKEFSFEMNFLQHDILNSLLIPRLEEYMPGKLEGRLDGEARTVMVDLRIPHIKYDQLSMDSLHITADAEPLGLKAEVHVDRVAYDTLPIEQLNMAFTLRQNQVNATFVTGNVETPDYYVHFQGTKTAEEWVLRIPEGTVVLNGSEWVVSPQNKLVRTQKGWSAHEFRLVQEQRSLVLTGTSESPEGLALVFEQFTLSSISGIIATHSPLLEGEMDGRLRLDSLLADIQLTGVSAFTYTVGELDIVAGQEKQGYGTQVLWTGQGHEVKIAGTIDPAAEEEQMDLHMQLSPFNTALVQGFVLQQVSELRGDIRGNIDVTGSFKAPVVNGSLLFEECSFRVVAIGTEYRLRQERIEAVDGVLRFQSFSVSDSAGRELTLDGTVTNKNYEDFEMDLDLHSKGFRVLNATAGGNNLFKGVMIVDIDAEISGTLSQPRLRGQIGVEDGTDAELVLPQRDLRAAAYEGTVEFYDEDIEQNPILGREKPSSELAGFRFTGINTNIDINIDPNAVVRLTVDEASGDQLYLKGGGKLAFGMDAFGNMSMSGVYRVQEGHYRLNFYELVKKQFRIREGSNIRWTGDPMTAELDIVAIYRVRTDPSSLFTGPVAGSGQVPIDVYLNMRGPLDMPEVDFDIEVPRGYEGVYGGQLKARLTEIAQNESELNKQVFGLLVLNSFLPEEGAEGSDEAIARASASRILTNQLNNLSGQYVKGVELDVNVSSYETRVEEQTAAGTELELALRKRFLDNRLEVQVGGDVGLEGQAAQQQNQASDYVGDVRASYKLTKDGRYQIRAFRENEFEDLFEGEVIETGAGISYTRSYDAIRELFRKPEETRTDGEEE